ncbi:MAG: thioredoxin [Saccharofermentans sp.]|nr:thioredoxin [Saccharofermentans sp.]
MRVKAIKLLSLLVIGATLISSCNSSQAAGGLNSRYSKYLGDIDYAASFAALSYEVIPDEEGRCGIVYREVSDRNGLWSQGTVPICLYFYNSMASGELSGVTAGVEDLAQVFSDSILFLAVDGVVETDLGSVFMVDAYPEFILLIPGLEPIKFEAGTNDDWAMSDVTYWIEQNGYAPDYSKLEA